LFDRSRLALVALAALLALAAAACSSSGADGIATSGTVPEAPASFPVTITDSSGVDVVIDAMPRRIISISPASTEILFAIGAGDQVIAVDEFSDHPPEAPTTDLSGFEPNVEAIATFEPDLVIMSFDPGDVVSALTALDIPAMQHFSANTLDDTYAQMEQLGIVTGHRDEAAALEVQMRADLDDLAAATTDLDPAPTYYHELDDTLFSATSATFIGSVYSMAGLVNIADEADVDGFGFPQLSVEYILEQDPDFIFLADTKCCGQDASTVAARPGWDELTAVREGRVIELDDDIASRWGPRIVEFFATITDAITPAEVN